jgi:hypothetical protein
MYYSVSIDVSIFIYINVCMYVCTLVRKLKKRCLENTFRSWSTCLSWLALSAESDKKKTHPFGETDLQVTRPLPVVYLSG